MYEGQGVPWARRQGRGGLSLRVKETRVNDGGGKVAWPLSCAMIPYQ